MDLTFLHSDDAARKAGNFNSMLADEPIRPKSLFGPPPASTDAHLLAAMPGEVLVDALTGEVRQAGADGALAANTLRDFKRLAERSLWVFARAVLGLDRLNATLHLPTCDWLQRCPPYRKLLLLPRDHLKSSIVAKALPIHMLVQPSSANIYRPSFAGINTRILLANETATNAQHFLRWIAGKLRNCALLRALWPNCVWEDTMRQAPKWNEQELILPRTIDYSEASIEAIGVGGAATSRHYDVIIKDDLVSLEAANSEVVMSTAGQWHLASRALLDDPVKGLEFIVGTRWAVGDIYEDMQEDSSIEVLKRGAFEYGSPIFPEIFTPAALQRLQLELGPLYSLLYMNTVSGTAGNDFDMALVRSWQGERAGEAGCASTPDALILAFAADDRDIVLTKRAAGPAPANIQGKRGTAALLNELLRRGERLHYD